MKQDLDAGRGDAPSESDRAWVGHLTVLLLGLYVALLAVGVFGVIFDIQPILDFFAFLNP